MWKWDEEESVAVPKVMRANCRRSGSLECGMVEFGADECDTRPAIGCLLQPTGFIQKLLSPSFYISSPASATDALLIHTMPCYTRAKRTNLTPCVLEHPPCLSYCDRSTSHILLGSFLKLQFTCLLAWLTFCLIHISLAPARFRTSLSSGSRPSHDGIVSSSTLPTRPFTTYTNNRLISIRYEYANPASLCLQISYFGTN